MDQTLSLPTIVQQEVEDYARGHWYKMRVYPVSDLKRQTYSLIVVPEADYPLDIDARVVLLAQVREDTVVIERDIADRPLYDQLIRVGVAPEQIVRVAAGEAL
jgi:hypothetical protein